MRYVLTNQEMREADRYTVEQGVPAIELMERAGIALANEAEKLAPEGEILCACGNGNNGGDGYVCARVLKARGRSVEVVCKEGKTSVACAENKSRWASMGGAELAEIPAKNYALIIDCTFGTGFHGELCGWEKKCAMQINALKKEGTKVLCADIPSGVNGEDGSVCGVAVRADVTLCLGAWKRGLVVGEGKKCAGNLRCADIGILFPRSDYPMLLDGKEVANTLPRRKAQSHKGTYGRAAIVAGSVAYTGAAYLSASACLRSGAGYTTLFLPSEILPYYILKAPEILLRASNEGGRYAFNEEKMQELLAYDAIVYGMGMGVSKEVYLGVKWLLERYEGKLILDADGLNSLAAYGKPFGELFANKKCDVVLTPHTKELSRLTETSVETLTEKGDLLARSFAADNVVNLLWKDATSRLTRGKEILLNATGNSGLAKGGSGDVLSGILVGLCAQGVDGYQAAACAAYLLGKAAELATEDVGEYSLTATDVVNCLGRAFLLVLSAENANENGSDY